MYLRQPWPDLAADPPFPNFISERSHSEAGSLETKFLTSSTNSRSRRSFRICFLTFADERPVAIVLFSHPRKLRQTFLFNESLYLFPVLASYVFYMIFLIRTSKFELNVEWSVKLLRDSRSTDSRRWELKNIQIIYWQSVSGTLISLVFPMIVLILNFPRSRKLRRWRIL